MSDSIAPHPTHSAHQRTVDLVVGCVTVLAAIMLCGMLFNVPPLILYPVPVVVGLIMFLGSHTRHGASTAVTTGIGIYTAALLVMFIVMGTTRHSLETFGGLPIATGVLVYIVWPATAISSGLFYAWIYSHWIAGDEEVVPPAELVE